MYARLSCPCFSPLARNGRDDGYGTAIDSRRSLLCVCCSVCGAQAQAKLRNQASNEQGQTAQQWAFGKPIHHKATKEKSKVFAGQAGSVGRL